MVAQVVDHQVQTRLGRDVGQGGKHLRWGAVVGTTGINDVIEGALGERLWGWCGFVPTS